MPVAIIPLFPLPIVLFPGQALPLHIFEPRYRALARHCIDAPCPFGLVFAQGEKIAEIGCTALILKTLKEYEDGRFDILTAGQTAFRLIGLREDKSYQEGEIEFLEEDFAGMDDRVSAQIEDLFYKCHRILFEQDATRIETGVGASLSFHVASELPVDVTFRQLLLELRSEAARQQRLLAHLIQWYPQLQKRERIRGKATGNGHSKL